MPPYLRVVELSACAKVWKQSSLDFSLMPMPESVTSNLIVTPAGGRFQKCL